MNKNQHIIYEEIINKNEFKSNQKNEIYKGVISKILMLSFMLILNIIFKK